MMEGVALWEVPFRQIRGDGEGDLSTPTTRLEAKYYRIDYKTVD